MLAAIHHLIEESTVHNTELAFLSLQIQINNLPIKLRNSDNTTHVMKTLERKQDVHYSVG